MNLIGGTHPRSDGLAKVCGSARYTVDYQAVDLLHGALLRSPVPAGKIRKLDISKALRMPGVRAVVSSADVQGRTGFLIKDQPAFAVNVVRYVGEPIAAVAADTLEQACCAVAAIVLKIEEQPALTDMSAALSEGAPLIHPDWASYELTLMGSHSDLRRHGNIAGELIADPAEVAEAFARAHRVVEDEFSDTRQYQAYLEPMSAVASYRNGRYTVYSGSQFPFNIRQDLSEYLGVRLSDIRVVQQTVGGAFGAKLCCGTEHYAAVLARCVGQGQPVKVVKNRTEDLVTAPCRENADIRIRSAIDKGGAIIARELICDLDCGAYSGETAVFPSLAFLLGGGVYRVGPMRVRSRAVYTNTPPTGAFRGVAGTHIFMAVEQHMDHIARELGEDRRAFRLRHLLRSGDTLINGQKLTDADILHEGFAAVEEMAPWDKLNREKAAYRGIGIGACIWLTSPQPGSISLQIDLDGTVSVVTAANENGSGAVAMGITQVVAQELGVSPSEVRIAEPDTDTCGYDAGSQGSHTTHIVGQAAMVATAEVRKKLFNVAADLLEANPEDLEIVEGHVGVLGSPGSRIPLSQVATAAMLQGKSLTGNGSYATPLPDYNPGCASGLVIPAFFTPTYHVHLAEVEVDPVTGNVKVLRYVVAQEVGRAINRAGILGQIQGGVAQGLGLALYESLRLKDGRYMEKTLEAYRLPLAVDIPRVEAHLMEHPDVAGPYGAKGVAEPPVVLGPAVIASAVSDAVGRPFNQIPITPEEVLMALQEQEDKLSDAAS